MSVKDLWAVKQVVQAAQKLHAVRLHTRLSDHDFFLIRTPRLPDPAVAVLMGYGGDAFGLSLFLGPGAMSTYEALYAAGGGSRSVRAMRQAQVLGYNMADYRELTHDARRWLKKGKIKARTHELYPDPMCIEPGKTPRSLLKDRETHLLLQAVQVILAAASDKRFKPCGVDNCGRVLCLRFGDNGEHPAVELEWEPAAKLETTDQQPSRSSESAVAASPRFDLNGLASSGDAWLVMLVPLPVAIDGDDRQPYLMAVCSRHTAGLWSHLMMTSEPPAVVDLLARLMRGEADESDSDDDLEMMGLEFADAVPPPVGLPDELIFDTPQLRDAAAPAFEPLGVACFDGAKDPRMQMMLDLLDEAMGLTGDGPEDLLDPTLVPAPDDLDAWKQVDHWFKHAVHEGFDSDDRYFGSRALNRYFGPDADSKALFRKYRPLLIIDSYAHWFTTSYRSSRGRPTLAEQWLEDRDMPPAYRQFLEAVIATGPSIYRVDEADEDAGKITFTDLFTGDITIATDFSLATCLEPGWLLPAILVPVGDFHFYFPAGPVMTSLYVGRVMDFLFQQKITPSPAFFRKQPHVLGWLWDLLAELEEAPVDLRNTDGHELIPHTAIFACPNRAALDDFLDSQPGFEPDEDPDAWVWLRQGFRIPDTPDGPRHCIDAASEVDDDNQVTLLGRLSLARDQFTLTTNSRERLDAAKAMFEKVAGVQLVSVETEPIDVAALAARRAGSGSDADPVDPQQMLPDEDAIAAARKYITDHYRRWLDEPVAALKGKTPRQAANDPRLRPKLITMIQTMPDPVMPGDSSLTINAPREMLLAELGLKR